MALDRSDIMRRVKPKHTTPELKVRRVLTDLRYRYRLHHPKLPGKPDIVFSGRRKAILVHGCFWHGHGCKRGARQPYANAAYWRDKIVRNKMRDAANLERMSQLGWRCLTLYECELSDPEALSQRLVAFLE